nr:hypothetical protein [Tanacetum cinerariifolium]
MMIEQSTDHPVFHMAQHVIPLAQLVPRYHTIGRCNNYAVLQETPDNPFVAPANIQTIEAFMNRVGYQGVVDKVVERDHYDDDSEDRLEPMSHKDNLENVDDDEHFEKEKKDEEVEKEKEDVKIEKEKIVDENVEKTDEVVKEKVVIDDIREVLDTYNQVGSELTFSKTNEIIKEMPRLIKLATDKDREATPVNISDMVSKEFATHGPKIIEELFQKHMKNTTLNLYPTTSSSTARKLSADLQE